MRSIATIVMTMACGAAAAQGPSGCRDAVHRQFDFWLGHWEVFTPDGKKAGDNHVAAIEGGCALIERWSGRGGFTGTSLNSWNADTRQWHQHWVDNQGGVLRLAGGLKGRRMVLAASEPDPKKPGATLRQRIAWTPLADGAVRQLWETSADNGATWTPVFDGKYVKVRPPS